MQRRSLSDRYRDDMIARRALLVGIGSVFAAPAIVKAQHIMRVRRMIWIPARKIALPDSAAGAIFTIINGSPDEPLTVFTPHGESITVCPGSAADVVNWGYKHDIIKVGVAAIDGCVDFGFIHGSEMSFKLKAA